MDSTQTTDPFGDQQKRERNQRILEMRRSGQSLREIASIVGVSHETVAHVCRKNGLGRVTLAQARALPTSDRQRILANWVTGENFKDIAKRENVYIATARRVVEEDASERDREARRIIMNKRRGNFGQRISNEDIYAAVRQCGEELGKRPTTEEYREWASRTKNPSAALIQKRMGWREAISAAGFEPIEKRGRGPQWTPEQCWKAAREARDHLGHAPSIGEYEENFGHREDYPGAQTLRHRCGGWQNLVKVLHEEAIETREHQTISEPVVVPVAEPAFAVGKPSEKKKWWKP